MNADNQQNQIEQEILSALELTEFPEGELSDRQLETAAGGVTLCAPIPFYNTRIKRTVCILGSRIRNANDLA
jgi:hypothetical protein